MHVPGTVCRPASWGLYQRSLLLPSASLHGAIPLVIAPWASLALVSGHAQQIFFFGFSGSACSQGGGLSR